MVELLNLYDFPLSLPFLQEALFMSNGPKAYDIIKAFAGDMSRKLVTCPNFFSYCNSRFH